MTISIPAPYYDGWWNSFKGGFWKSHRFWFCHDDLNHYVGGFGTKYEVDRPLLLVLWPIQEGTNLGCNNPEGDINKKR
jgi:hypothetical protein